MDGCTELLWALGEAGVAWRQQRFAQYVCGGTSACVGACWPPSLLFAGPRGTLQLLVHFKLILLMLSSFILLSLSVNVFFALHILCVTLTQSTANF